MSNKIKKGMKKIIKHPPPPKKLVKKTPFKGKGQEPMDVDGLPE